MKTRKTRSHLRTLGIAGVGNLLTIDPARRSLQSSLFLVVPAALALGWAATAAADDDQKFPSTGQTTCYDNTGAIPCAGTGQDGEIRAGAKLRYKDNGDGTILDLNILLVWEKKSDDDPLIQQGPKLTGSGESGIGGFGDSVALSSDGNTALIGGPLDNSEVGAAWVFTRSGSTWTQQGEKLTGSGESGIGDFGNGVALSSDGNTALIGGPLDNSEVGAAWVFTRSGSTWTQQGEKLTGSGEIGKGRFGTSVALSSHGNTALIGGSRDNSRVGAAWVFTRSGSTWTQRGEKLTGSGEIGQGHFGAAVALSSNGRTALIGGTDDNSEVGAAWVFRRSGSTWTQQGEKLIGSGESGKGFFGNGVPLSSDGNTALIGGPGDSSCVGAAWVFVNPRREAP